MIFLIFFNVIVVRRILLYAKQLELVDFGEPIATFLVLEVVKAPVRVAETVHLVHQGEKLAAIRARRTTIKRETKEAREVQQLNGFKHL